MCLILQISQAVLDYRGYQFCWIPKLSSTVTQISQLSLALKILYNFVMGKTPLFSYYGPSIRQPSSATRNIRQFQTITMLNKRNIFKQVSSDNRPIK